MLLVSPPRDDSAVNNDPSYVFFLLLEGEEKLFMHENFSYQAALNSLY